VTTISGISKGIMTAGISSEESETGNLLASFAALSVNLSAMLNGKCNAMQCK